MAAIADIEGGHQDIVKSVQCLEYELDFDNKRTIVEARGRLNMALCNIKHPVRVSLVLLTELLLTLTCFPDPGGVQ